MQAQRRNWVLHFMFTFRKPRIYHQIDMYVKDKSVRYPYEAQKDYLELVKFVSLTGIEDIYDLNKEHIEKLRNSFDRRDFASRDRLITMRCFVRFHKNIIPKQLGENMRLLEYKERI